MMIAKTATDCVTAKIISREGGANPLSVATGGARGRVWALTPMCAAPACLLWVRGLFLMPALGETADPSPRFAVNVLLKIRQ